MTTPVELWMDQVSGSGWEWFVKYLAGNDTLLTDSHQAGPYVPKKIGFGLFPSVADPELHNPRARISAAIDSHSAQADAAIIWYNNRIRGGTRDECRLTGWGGRRSPILDPDSTGSLCVFAFFKPAFADAEEARVWLCRTVDEEDLVLDRVGPVEPGGGVLYEAGAQSTKPASVATQDSPCRMAPNEMPAAWRLEFPSAVSIVDIAVSRVPTTRQNDPDKRLLRRRACEFELFRSIEEVLVLPRIREGFGSVDIFVDFANTVTNRRKNRSGASLELHAKRIFDEEQLPYSWDQVSEGKKRPDFLFPSVAAYRDPSIPAEKLQMLGVKTTCKDRWRQILNEADRIPRKHLLTLQEGISVNQLNEMAAEGVTLVVPAKLHRRYPVSHRHLLITLAQFIRSTVAKCT